MDVSTGYRDISPKGQENILEVNGILLNQSVLILSLDTLFISPILEQKLQEYLKKIQWDGQLLLFATHTHFAPMTDETKPLLGMSDTHYREWIFQQCCDLITQLLCDVNGSVRIFYHVGYGQHAIYRRRWGRSLSTSHLFQKQMLRLPNREKPTDPYIRILSFYSDQGKLLAVLWSYACHPVSYYDESALSADFPGFLRESIRKQFNQIPVIYLQGFSGNLRPPAFAKKLNGKMWKYLIKRIVQGEHFGSFSSNEYFNWISQLTMDVIQTLKHPIKEITPKLEMLSTEIPLQELIENVQSDNNLTIKRISFSQDCHLVGFSAEVSVEYVMMLRNLLQNSDVIPVGCMSSVYGYLPTDQMIAEGGYEVSGFFERFSLQGAYKPQVEQKIEDAIKLVMP